MVSRTMVVLTDDLDGGDASETVHFGLDGTHYEIDLASANANKLRLALATYIGAGRKLGKADYQRRQLVPTRPARDKWLDNLADRSGKRKDFGVARPSGTTKDERDEIRAWAGRFGVTVAERGRIPERVVDAWRAKDPSIMGVRVASTPKPQPQPELEEPELEEPELEEPELEEPELEEPEEPPVMPQSKTPKQKAESLKPEFKPEPGVKGRQRRAAAVQAARGPRTATRA